MAVLRRVVSHVLMFHFFLRLGYGFALVAVLRRGYLMFLCFIFSCSAGYGLAPFYVLLLGFLGCDTAWYRGLLCSYVFNLPSFPIYGTDVVVHNDV